MPEAVHADPRNQIEVLLTAVIPNVGAFTFHQQ